MNTVSISQLKAAPSKAISQSIDFPVAVENRNKIEAYLVGKKLYEKMVAYIENFVDKQALEKADYKSGEDFEKVTVELGI